MTANNIMEVYIKKIAFVFPPSSLNSVGVENSFIPNGILTLSKQLKHWRNDIEVKVFDGSVMGVPDIIESILEFAPQLVGVSALCGNYKPGKRILEACHNAGIITLVGNHHANYLWEIIPSLPVGQLAAIDYIITGNSDIETLRPLIEAIENEGKFIDQVPNLCYKTKGEWIRPQRIRYNPATLATPDLSYISDFEPYFINYRNIFHRFHTNPEQVKPININFFKGCIQGATSPCIYCCLKDHKLQHTEPEVFWQHISDLYHHFGFNYFFETANSITSLSSIAFTHSRNYLEGIVHAMPDELKGKIGFMVYGRADELKPEVIGLLKAMQVTRVVIGFDSGDPDLLKTGINKDNITPGMNYGVAKQLSDNGIQIYGCYVPGAKGETLDTLKITRDEILKIMELPLCCAIEYTSLAPMPGSGAWRKIRKDFFAENGVSDVLDVEKIAKFWVKKMVPIIDWEMVENIKYEIQLKAAHYGVVFGGYY